MKKTLFSIALATLALAACKKDAGMSPKDNTAKTSATVKVVQDTIADHAMFKIVLAKDSVNHDETLIMFDHTANTNYRPNDDALYFPGFGKVSLASVSADGKSMAIYTLPYKTTMYIRLNVNTATDGDYSLELNYQKHMPENLHVWIKDAYMKDSLDVSSGSYNFKVVKADTNSFGSKRFSLVFRQAQQTAHN
ncbi:MAG: hypothetical protein JSU01_14785 [Bacteroidetes bacterium]|nr:hypothetical protein [Bacteroidota bacterium]